MKRFVLLLLLAALPMQTAWAVGRWHCSEHPGHHGHAHVPHEGSQASHAHVPHDGSDASHAHDIGDEDGDAGHTTGSGPDCNAFSFVALDSSEAPAQWLPQAGSAAQDVRYPAYKSHIPDGPDRPRWGFAV